MDAKIFLVAAKEEKIIHAQDRNFQTGKMHIRAIGVVGCDVIIADQMNSCLKLFGYIEPPEKPYDKTKVARFKQRIPLKNNPFHLSVCP